MRKIGVLSACLLLLSFVTAHGIEGFRGHAWETTRSEVIRIEGTPDHVDEAEGIIRYVGLQIGPHPVQATFYFTTDGVLLGGDYFFTVRHLFDADNYIRDFQDVDRRLSSVYGEPRLHETVWIGERGSLSGAAVLNGDLILRSGWESEQGVIIHIIQTSVSGVGVDHSIGYITRQFMTLDEAIGNMDTGGL